MRILLISDIHANLAALEAVLADARPFDEVWCLGDLVGYGPDPNECVERLCRLPHLRCLVGNHDKAALGEIDLHAFNVDARIALAWTQAALTPSSRAYLESLPERLETDRYTLVHGSPRRPVWEYILDRNIASLNFPYFDTPYCLVGHTHSPMVFTELPESRSCDERKPVARMPLRLNSHRRILNAGSVGQPRDGNPEAAYAVIDSDAETWEYRRVAYDVAATQARMLQHNLPERLVARLALGW